MASSVTENPKTKRAEETQPKPYRFTVEEYEKAAFAGAFAGRVELLNGEVVQMPAMGDPHYVALWRLNKELIRKLGDLALVAQQAPIRAVDQDGEPEPDFALVPLERFENKVPDAGAVVLAVEISDTTLKVDREVKLPIYARAGIPEAWILNLKKMQLEVYRDPQDSEYASKQTLNKGQSIAPQAFPNVQIEWW